jgi:7-keto-8-aminopelargonate synthetase-like enzyme
VPASVCGSAIAALEILREEPHRQARLRESARRARRAVSEIGFEIPAGDSPIIPVIFGSEEAALGAAQAIFERGILVPAVRPPTVPKGSSRLRVTLSCDHRDDDVEKLLEALRELRARSPL